MTIPSGGQQKLASSISPLIQNQPLERHYCPIPLKHSQFPQNHHHPLESPYLASSLNSSASLPQRPYNKIIAFSVQHNPMENQENSWEQSLQDIPERYPQHQPRAAQSMNRNAELLAAKERLAAFMGELGQHRKSDIREDVLAHCQQVNKNKKVVGCYISDQTVLRLAATRIEKMVKNKKLKKNWSEEDVRILVWVVSKYCDQQGIANIQKDLGVDDWERVAQLIPGVAGSNCMFKWLSIRKTNLSNCSWSAEESELLRAIIEEQQGVRSVDEFTHMNWKTVAEDLYHRNASLSKVFRSSKQCRQHWNCFLNPRLKKGPWLASEDMQLLTLIKNNNGSKKWSEIVYYFQGRTENALKNRYTLLLDKQRRISKSKQEISLVQDCLERYYVQQMNSNGYRQEIVLQPTVDFKQQVDPYPELNKESSQSDSCDKQWQNIKNEENTLTSSLPDSSSPSRTVTKIHYLTSSDQLQFLQWMKRRSDIRRCCLRNGSFQMQE